MPYISPGGSGIAGIDIQEDGVSQVDPATALNFDPNDFEITDEGGGVAGVSLDATLFAGTFLAIDGSNRMQVNGPVRTLDGRIRKEVGALPADVSYSFDSGPDLNEDLYSVGVNLNTALASAGISCVVINENINSASAFGVFGPSPCNVSGLTGYTDRHRIDSRFTIDGDFDVAFRFNMDGASHSADIAHSFRARVTDGSQTALLTIHTRSTDLVSAVRLIGSIDGVAGSTLNINFPGGDRKGWVRITRVGTAVTTYYAADNASDTPPGSWTTYQTDVTSSMTGTVTITVGFIPKTNIQPSIGTTWTIEALAVVVTSADTINAPDPVGSGIMFDVNGELDNDIAHSSWRHDTGTSPINLAKLLKRTNGTELQIFPSDGLDYGSIFQDDGETAGSTTKIGLSETSRRLVICDLGDIETDTTLGASNQPVVIIFDADFGSAVALGMRAGLSSLYSAGGVPTVLEIQGPSLNNVQFFSEVGTSFNNRYIRIYGHNDSNEGYISILFDGTDGVIGVGGTDAENLLLTTDQVKIGAASDFILMNDAAESSGGTGKIGVPADTRRLIICDEGDITTDSTLAASSHPTISLFDATFAENLDLYHDGTDGQLDLSTGNIEYSRAGTPVGYLGVIRQRTGSDWAAGTLTDEVDIGLRTDPPEDYLSVNMAGAFFKIGFGACAAFAGIYNNGTESGQAITAGSPVTFNQFTTNFGTDRSAVADAANNRITIVEAGTYLIIWSAHVDVTAGAVVAFRARADSTDIPMGISDIDTNIVVDQLTSTFNALYTFTAGQQLTVLVSVDTNTTVTVDHAQLVVIRIA